jgi:type I restriction enzyme M protein
MDAAEYKHVVLGLIFLKHVSDAFEAHRAKLESLPHADPEHPDEYRAVNVFWVPKEARWGHLRASAKQPTIGQFLDQAMDAIERDNPSLKGVLPKDFARPGLDQIRLGQLIDLISNIGLGGPDDQDRDVLGRVYEYFLAKFASAEGKLGGQFYTPRPVVRLLVEMLSPYRGRVFDPCCGSGGIFVQSIEFIRAHATGNGNGGRAKGDISIYGQESNYTTWRLANMNLAMRGIEARIAHGDSFHDDQHPDLKADFVLANPPFNNSEWRGDLLQADKRWKYGVPPKGNANYAWIQHFIHHLSPTGTAGFVMANGSMSSNQSGEGEIRKNIIEADLVDCIVALPGQLFYSTQIPVCLWFLTRDKSGRSPSTLAGEGQDSPSPGAGEGHTSPSPREAWGRAGVGDRDRRGETLFIDARKLGTMISRVQRELTHDDVAKIAGAYHAWRSVPPPAANTEKSHASPSAHAGEDHTSPSPLVGEGRGGGEITAYADIPGFCRSATLDEIRKHGHVLTPGRYVGAEAQEDDGEPFEEKMKRLTATLREQQAEAARLDAAIADNLKELGYGH